MIHLGQHWPSPGLHDALVSAEHLQSAPHLQDGPQQQPASAHRTQRVTQSNRRSGVVNGTTVRALALGPFSQKKIKIELKDDAKNELKYFIL